MELLYTWKDVERKIKDYIGKNDCSYINDIDVYTSEIVVTTNSVENEQKVKEMFQLIFEKKYNLENNTVCLDKFDVVMKIDIEFDDAIYHKKEIMPLFREVIYENKSYNEEILSDSRLTECPVIAFHSYKGGVGRTLSLLAFAKAWSSHKENEKLLIVDSDIEAPGLTWLMGEESLDREKFSYLDLLEMIQSRQTDDEKVMNGIADLIKTSTFSIDTGKVLTKHYVLPTYRYEQQLLDIYANPESIARGYDRNYVLAEILSDIGKRVGVSMVLVDLRAGVSEFSAPLIFDPRVKKYVVTSTSFQSVQGTKMLMEQICKGLPVSEEGVVPEILLTMVPKELDVTDIRSELVKAYDVVDSDSTYIDNVVTELPFASELVHLSSLSRILENLSGRDFYKKIDELVMNCYDDVDAVVESKLKDSRESVVKKIHELADAQITAEGSSEFAILQTRSISNLIKKFADNVPQVVILGAKGSGKTFLFREMLRKKKWETFIRNFEGVTPGNTETYVIPLIAPKSLDDFLIDIIGKTVSEFQSQISIASENENYWHDNSNETLVFKRSENDELEWAIFWKQCILRAFQGDMDLLQIDEFLQKNNQRVLFLVDGLEEIFENTMDLQDEKFAIRALVQTLLNEFKIKYQNIGLLIFLRKDLASNSLAVNQEQFERQYRFMALDWSHREALRLALWLVSKAVPEFCQGIDPEQASDDVIEDYLNKLWGVKLGKKNSNEAYSSRWILAALSDFNSQLQARDIIRFLKNATETVGKQFVYDDRYIMPKEIKNAVQECSKAKISEIKQEIISLKETLEALENASSDKKVLPFKSDTFNWSATQEKMLKQEGLLIIDDDRYYLPEIIRHALKFKYEKGARPKVLSLLLKKTKDL